MSSRKSSPSFNRRNAFLLCVTPVVPGAAFFGLAVASGPTTAIAAASALLVAGSAGVYHAVQRIEERLVRAA